MIQKVLLGVLLPACLALAAFLVAWRPWQRASLPREGHWGAPIAFAAAFLVSFIAEAGWPVTETPDGWQLKLDRWEWIAPLALAALAAGLLAAFIPRPTRFSLFLAFVAGLVTSWWLKLPGLEGIWPRLGLGAAVVLHFAFVNPIAERRPGVLVPLAYMLIFAAASGVVMQAGFAKLAIMCGAISASCGMALLVAILNREFSLARGGMILLSVLLPVIMACGYAYDYTALNALCFVLPVLAPLALWVGELPIVKKLRPWQASALRIVLVIIPCAIAGALALSAGMSAAEGDPYEYYY